MVKRFWLPNPSFATQRLVDHVSRGTFDGIHNLGQRVNLHRLLVDQRCEDHVNMIWHHDSNSEIEHLSVIVETTLQHLGSHAFRKNPSVISAECYKVLPIVPLKMRKLSAIKSLRHRFYVGTAALGCPAERSSAMKSSRNGRAVGFGEPYKF
jgi:hypothetical protein